MSKTLRRGFILACVLALTAGCGEKGHRHAGAGGFRPVEVETGDIQVTVLSTGNVQPNNELAVFPPSACRIEHIRVKEGDTVRKGQNLMDLSSTERATVLDEAAAQGASQLAYWQQIYQETPLISPENGQVIYLPTVPGQICSTGTTMMVMSDHLMVNTQVDETDLAQIKLGEAATITLDAYPDKPFAGKVHRISYFSTLVNNVTTYEVDVWPVTVPTFMRTGMTANVVFTVATKENVLTIPSSALQQEDGQTGVYVPGDDHKPKFQTIQTGVTDGNNVEVVSGLNEGDKVLIKAFSAGQFAQTQTGGTNNPLMPGMGGGTHGGGGYGGGH